LAHGLFWAAGLLALLAVWVNAKYRGGSWPETVGVAVVAAAALAAGLLQLRAPAGTEAPEALARRRRTLGLGILAARGLLVLVAIWAAVNHGLEAFPEVCGSVLFALVGVGVGLGQLAPPGDQPASQRVLERLSRKRWPFAITLLAAGGVLGLLGVGAITPL